MAIGVVSDKEIKKLISDGSILSKSGIREEQIQPSSIDLTIGAKGFCVNSSSIPESDNLTDFFQSRSNYKLDLSKETFLHKGYVYVVQLNEFLKLPEYLQAKANPKSSIGRTDIHVRLITENGKSFDKIAGGYKGELWIEICPRSFDIICKEGISLNQLRVFNTNSRGLNSGELSTLHKEEGILFYPIQKMKKIDSLENLLDNGELNIRLDLSNKISGYTAKKYAPPVNLLRKDNRASEYFEMVNIKNKEIIISEDSFYILNSFEIINIPEGYCAEFLEVDTSSGEFRAHYAGFFDPGFCAQGVLELRNIGGTPFTIKDKQKIATVRYFQLKELPEKVYGRKINSTYQGQKGPKLAKFFDMKK